MVYKKNMNMEFISLEGEGEVIFDHVLKKVHILNEIGQDIFILCDGKNSLQEIKRILAEEYGKELAEVDKDIDEFMNELLDKNLVYMVNSNDY